MTFIAIQLTGCHEMLDLGVVKLGTVTKQFYIFYFFCLACTLLVCNPFVGFLSTFLANILDDIY